MKFRTIALVSSVAALFGAQAYAQSNATPNPSGSSAGGAPSTPNTGMSGATTGGATTESAAKSPNPTDGRSGGAGPMSGTPQTDRTLSRKPSMVPNQMNRRSGSVASSEETRQLQQALEAKGHAVGGVDGRMGRKTHSALREYQRKQGIAQSGRLDDATRSSLGMPGRTVGMSGSRAN